MKYLVDCCINCICIVYIFCVLFLVVLLCSCSTPEYLPSKEIKPIYPNITRCPNLIQPTIETMGQSILDNYIQYKKCQSQVEILLKFINWEQNK